MKKHFLFALVLWVFVCSFAANETHGTNGLLDQHTIKIQNAFKQFLPQADSMIISPFKSGLSTIRKLFRCTVHEKEYIAVLLSGELEKRKNEVEAHKAAMRIGIAPHIFYCDEYYTIMIIEFLEGNIITFDQANQNWVLDQIAHSLREVQQVKIDAPRENVFDQTVRYYTRLIKKQTALNPQFEKMMEIVKTIEQKIVAYGQPFVLSHNDLLPGNIMITNKKISIIDWEEVASCHAFLDLAKFSVFLCVHPESDFYLLSQYLAKQPTQNDMESFALMKQVVRASHALRLFNYIGGQEESTVLHELGLKSVEIKNFEHYQAIFAVNSQPQSVQFFYEMATSLMQDFFEHESRCCCDGYLCETDFDAKIFEYCRFTANSHIAVVLPASFNKRNAVQDVLSEHSYVVYEKSIFLRNNGPANFLGLLRGIEWFTPSHLSFLRELEQELFLAQNPIKVYFFEANSAENLNKIEKLLYSLDTNNGIYVSIDRGRTVALAQSILNKNSITHLNNAALIPKPNFERMLREFKKWLAANHIDPEMICINGRAVLSARGERDCAQITFLRHGYAKEVSDLNSPFLLGDNASIKTQSAIDAILFNPALHFYYKGCKFALLK